MKFDLKQPCNNCPFRTDVDFYLDDHRVQEICDSITRNQQTFACHKTTRFDDDGETVPHKKEQHCAGALIMLEHMNQPNQMMRIAERCGFYDRNKLDMDALVFEHTDEMIEEYEVRNAFGRK